MDIDELLEKYKKWVETLVEHRVENDEEGYRWVVADFSPEDLKYTTFFDLFERDDLNEKYTTNYKLPAESKESYAFQQQEINMINSFHKGFAMRHKTRLQYYRNDLSQKDVHTYTAVNNAVGKFKAHSDFTDDKKPCS